MCHISRASGTVSLQTIGSFCSSSDLSLAEEHEEIVKNGQRLKRIVKSQIDGMLKLI